MRAREEIPPQFFCVLLNDSDSGFGFRARFRDERHAARNVGFGVFYRVGRAGEEAGESSRIRGNGCGEKRGTACGIKHGAMEESAMKR